jgi:hypothetical protein
LFSILKALINVISFIPKILKSKKKKFFRNLNIFYFFFKIICYLKKKKIIIFFIVQKKKKLLMLFIAIKSISIKPDLVVIDNFIKDK